MGEIMPSPSSSNSVNPRGSLLSSPSMPPTKARASAKSIFLSPLTSMAPNFAISSSPWVGTSPVITSMKDPVLHLPAQLQQKMLQPPVAQHGVPWVPSPHIQLEFPLPQHMA